MRKLKVGDKIKQLHHVFGDDVSPYAIVSKIEDGIVWHKHIGKDYTKSTREPLSKEFGDRIEIESIQFIFADEETQSTDELQAIVEQIITALKGGE